jgi:cardiolipin synthase A/B
VPGIDLGAGWTGGNRFQLLENGEEYFPAVSAAIAAACREVIVETFILFDDEVGRQIQAALIAAARRGVEVDLTVDGYGSPDLSQQFVAQLVDAGVRLHIFDPRRRLLGMRLNIFRRMHRKIVAIDGTVAFIGGINYSADHLMSFGPKAKQDYAVRIDGPLAAEIHRFARQQAAVFYRRGAWPMRWAHNLYRWSRPHTPDRSDTDSRAVLVIRDNGYHRDDIERHYRAAIRAARHDVLIACAYFFPGYQLLRQLRHAARRGVRVRLILQGNPDMPQARKWATLLYPSLLAAGVEIYEYNRRPLHAKIAVIDDTWATIGSSNLDPLSLALNLEANIVLRDRQFNRDVRARLQPLLCADCRQVRHDDMPQSGWWSILSNLVAYHCTRHFPRWAGWLPAHLPKLQVLAREAEPVQAQRSVR